MITSMQFVSEYTIRAHEIAPDYTLKRHHVCSYFQDAATLFFAGLGIASFDLQDRGFTWVVTRMYCKFHSPVPRWAHAGHRMAPPRGKLQTVSGL
jgi:acyl-CoA thioesterase FadM